MKHTLKLIALALLIAGSTTQSYAATQDYHFEIADQTLHTGKDVPITVKLTQAGKPITDATIVGQKLVMLMGSMTMPTQVKTLPSDASGNYRFAADLTMAGDWQLDLVAKVPGETDNLLAVLKFQVVK